MVLTCRPCNVERGGSEIDRYASRREQWVNSLTTGPVIPHDGTASIGGVELAGEVYAGPGSIGFSASQDPDVNSPAAIAAFEQALRAPTVTSHSITQSPNIPWDLATLSCARAAFLASFAVFGWSHIFRPAFEPLHRRLGLGEDVPLPPAMVRYDPNETSTDNTMLIINEPGPQQGVLMIRMAKSTVVMPGPDDTRTLDEVAQAIASVAPNGESRRFEGLLIPWPTEPIHAGDPDPPE